MDFVLPLLPALFLIAYGVSLVFGNNTKAFDTNFMLFLCLSGVILAIDLFLTYVFKLVLVGDLLSFLFYGILVSLAYLIHKEEKTRYSKFLLYLLAIGAFFQFFSYLVILLT